MKHNCLTLLLSLMAVVALSAQNMQRSIPRQPKAEPKAKIEVETVVAKYDTIVPAAGQIVVAGFEKPLRENKESMFVTNDSEREICALTLEINYLDSKQRQLHKATHSVWVDIPVGETRRIQVKSFDNTKLFYYHKTALPRNPKQATPFWVEIKVVDITCLKSAEK